MFRMLSILAACAFALAGSSLAEEGGLALGLVYDTSGSMQQPVKDRSGEATPKHLIGNRALEMVITRLEAHQIQNAPSPFEVGLFVFQGDTARAAVPYGRFEAAPLREFIKSAPKPNGRTPLG